MFFRGQSVEYVIWIKSVFKCILIIFFKDIILDIIIILYKIQCSLSMCHIHAGRKGHCDDFQHSLPYKRMDFTYQSSTLLLVFMNSFLSFSTFPNFWKASFAVPILLRISASHFPLSEIILPGYSNFSICFIVTSPTFSLHLGVFLLLTTENFAFLQLIVNLFFYYFV